MKKLIRLKKEFEKACKGYVEVFMKKQGLVEDDGELYPHEWLGSDVGGVLIVGDEYISFDDIRVDVDQNIERGKYFDYYYHSVEGGYKGNYRSYLMGRR